VGFQPVHTTVTRKKVAGIEVVPSADSLLAHHF